MASYDESHMVDLGILLFDTLMSTFEDISTN